MEYEHSTSAVSPEKNAPEVSSCHRGRHGRGRVLALVFLMMLSGFIGGLVAPVALRFSQEHSFLGGNLVSAPEQQKVTIITEENAVSDLVEKKSPGVVSIVISKDVPKVRSFYGTPFQGFPFFSPFSTPNNGGNSKNTGETEKQKVGSGSGFFISADGLIVTNKHVVADEQADYTVIVNGGTEYPATVLARDPVNDIAIIKIDGKDFPALDLGDSEKIKVGETVIAIGNPLGEFANSVSRGIISGLQRNLDAGSGFGDSERLSGIIQIDAAINPGNSGGPLFNLAGEVIGVNVAMAQGAESIGFSLPINQVKRIAEQVRTTGKITTPYLGVRSIILNKDIQKKNGLPFDYGALVLRGETLTDFAVVPGSPADKAGIMENDVILEINGTHVDVDHSLLTFMGQYNVGDVITLKVWHKGETKDVKVTLEERK